MIPQLREALRESQPNKNVLNIEEFQFGITPKSIGREIEEL